MGILRLFAGGGRAGVDLPKDADIIAVVSFGATAIELTEASRCAVALAGDLKKVYPRAVVISGSFKHNPLANVEKYEKWKTLPHAIYAGPVESTIEEAERIRDDLMARGFKPRSIIIVTDDWHSRSAKLVWEKIWAEAKPRPAIAFSTFAWPEDPDNPMIFQRKE